MSSSVKRTAQEVASTPAMRALARAGFAASGVIHIGIGVLAIVVASHGRGEADQTGALKAIASVPVGFVVLWVIAIALFALALWYLVEGVLAAGTGTSKWKRRLSSWGKAVGYAFIGVVSAIVASGGKPDSEKSAKRVGGTLLAQPGGPFLLAAMGLVIAGVGIYFGWRGITRRFREDLDTPSGPAGKGVMAVGVVGYVAKGAALLAVGVLLVVAAVEVNPDATGGIDGALSALVRLPSGPVLVTGIGVGLIAYGVYMFARALRSNAAGSSP